MERPPPSGPTTRAEPRRLHGPPPLRRPGLRCRRLAEGRPAASGIECRPHRASLPASLHGPPPPLCQPGLPRHHGGRETQLRKANGNTWRPRPKALPQCPNQNPQNIPCRRHSHLNKMQQKPSPSVPSTSSSDCSPFFHSTYFLPLLCGSSVSPGQRVGGCRQCRRPQCPG